MNTEQQSVLKEAIKRKARKLLSEGKDLFAGSFTNGSGEPMLDFTKIGDGIRACYCYNHRMWYFIFDINELL